MHYETIPHKTSLSGSAEVKIGSDLVTSNLLPDIKTRIPPPLVAHCSVSLSKLNNSAKNSNSVIFDSLLLEPVSKELQTSSSYVVQTVLTGGLHQGSYF